LVEKVVFDEEEQEIVSRFWSTVVKVTGLCVEAGFFEMLMIDLEFLGIFL